MALPSETGVKGRPVIMQTYARRCMDCSLIIRKATQMIDLASCILFISTDDDDGKVRCTCAIRPYPLATVGRPGTAAVRYT